jgi:hypothetical protein
MVADYYGVDYIGMILTTSEKEKWMRGYKNI